MSLSNFIREHTDAILEEWMEFASTLAPAKYKFDRTMLLDHARHMLEAIAADLATPESAYEQAQKSRGLGPQPLHARTTAAWMEKPFHIKRHDIDIRASIGIALAPADAETPDALMALADHAMYASKAAGGNRFSFFSRAAPDGQESARI